MIKILKIKFLLVPGSDVQSLKQPIPVEYK